MIKKFGIYNIVSQIVERVYTAKAQKSIPLGANQVQFEMSPSFGEYWNEVDAYIWTGTNVIYDTNYAPPKNVPNFVTARQLRLALLGAGITGSQVEAIINALPEPERSAALIDWEYATEFDRVDPMIDSIGAALGLSQDEIDDLYVAGAGL